MPYSLQSFDGTQVIITECGASNKCPPEVCPAEVCPAEVCPVEVCLDEVCLRRSAPRRSASLRFGSPLNVFSLHAFQASTPFLIIFRCSLFAILPRSLTAAWLKRRGAFFVIGFYIMER